MLEIFDKATEYARRNMRMSDYYAIANRLEREGKTGEWRLHHQAHKVLNMAMDRCYENRRSNPQPDPVTLGELLEEISCMKAKYGHGWSHEGQWHIKDYRSSDDLMDMLQFLRRMDIHFKRLDNNELDQSVHLRISDEDFDLIYNPVKDFEHKQWGRG